MSQVETDCFRLGRHAMFAALRDSLPATDAAASAVVGAQNLLECKDDMLFAWHAGDCAVLALNWRAAYAKESSSVAYQVSRAVARSARANSSVAHITSECARLRGEGG